MYRYSFYACCLCDLCNLHSINVFSIPALSDLHRNRLPRRIIYHRLKDPACKKRILHKGGTLTVTRYLRNGTPHIKIYYLK